MNRATALAYAEIELRERRREGRVVSRGPSRNPAHRRALAPFPNRYAKEIFGIELDPQQTEAFENLIRYPNQLWPGGNNIGKSVLGALAAWWVYDARAALPDDEQNLPEQGARVLLGGPDADSIFATIYTRMLGLAEQARQRGYLMPGTISERSVYAFAGPEWRIEPLTAPRKVGERQAHGAAGRHHRNLIVILEEGCGIGESIWTAAEGMASSRGNMILSPTNPTESGGSFHARATGGKRRYFVFHLSAFRHPNVLQRAEVIPAAIDYLKVDERVHDFCLCLGRYPDVLPDSLFDDFVYAVPAPGEPERGPRTDGFLGHPDGELKVYRPDARFSATVLGKFPTEADGGLFSPGALDASMARWRERALPAGPPDRVGVDAAREGSDSTVHCPAWGKTAAALLERYHLLRKDRKDPAVEMADEVVYVGSPRIAPKGTGDVVAAHLVGIYPDKATPWLIDNGSVGVSIIDTARAFLKMNVVPVDFGGAAPKRVPEEYYCLNKRSALYVRGAMLVNAGLVDTPDDAMLREELLAHRIIWKDDMVEEMEGGRKVRRLVNVAKILEKAEVKKALGRSPDRADAFLLALDEPPAKRAGPLWGFAYAQ